MSKRHLKSAVLIPNLWCSFQTWSHLCQLATLFFQWLINSTLPLYLTFYQEISFTVVSKNIKSWIFYRRLFRACSSLAWSVGAASAVSLDPLSNQASCSKCSSNYTCSLFKAYDRPWSLSVWPSSHTHYTLEKPESLNYPRPWIVPASITSLTSPKALAFLFPHKLPCFCDVSEHHVGMFWTKRLTIASFWKFLAQLLPWLQIATWWIN